MTKKVLDTRVVKFTLDRRRECKKCNHRFTTTKGVVITAELKVIKNNDTISKSIQSACCGSITQQGIENILNYIFEQFSKRRLSKIRSKYLRKLVLNKLKELNEVTYIRYASVYFHFKAIAELHNLLKGFHYAN